MKDRKITKDLRNRIVDAILTNMDNKVRSEMCTMEAELSPALYTILLEQHGVDAEELGRVPDGWLPTVTMVRALYCGVDTHVNMDGSYPAPYNVTQKRLAPPVTVPDGSPLVHTLRAYEQAARKHRSIRQWAHIDSVNSIISAFKTVNGLLSQIPQLAPFIPSAETTLPPPSAQPLVNVSEVTKNLML